MHNAFSSWRRVSSDGDSERKFCRTNFLSRQVCPSFVKNRTLVHSPFFRRICSRSKNFGSSFLRKFSIYLSYFLNVTSISSRYLIDARLVQADKALVRLLSRQVLAPLLSAPALRPNSIHRARFNRSRTRFVFLPSEFDIYSENNALVNAALTAGLYPKILKVDPTDGQLSTTTNSQAVTFHPSSVNFRRKPQDFSVNHLAFFTIM